MLLQLYIAAHCPLRPTCSPLPLPCPAPPAPPPKKTYVALHVEPLQRIHHTPAAAGTTPTAAAAVAPPAPSPIARSGRPIRCRRRLASTDEGVFVGADGQRFHQLRRRAHHSQQ